MPLNLTHWALTLVLSLLVLVLFHIFVLLYVFPAEDSIPAKILAYNRANRAVALLCNHQRAPPKTFEKSMQNLQTKVNCPLVHLSRAFLLLLQAETILLSFILEGNFLIFFFPALWQVIMFLLNLLQILFSTLPCFFLMFAD